MTAQAQLAFVNFTKNAYITMEGREEADRFFIIRSGNVHISKRMPVVPEESGYVLGPGDFFGVISTMLSQKCSETAQALTDVTLIAVKRDQYSQLIHSNAAVAIKIVMQFSKKMRFLNESLTMLTLNKTSEGDPDQIFKAAEFYARQNMYDQAYYAYNQYLKHCRQGSFLEEARQKITKISPFIKTKSNFQPDDATRNYPKGAMFFCEAEPGSELFIIQSGSVKITKIVENDEVQLAILKAGDIFGEMALLESMPRSASAVANEDCKVMVVSWANFKHMIQTQPQLITKLTTLLAERIWLSYKQLANTKIADPLKRIYDVLQTHLEKKHINPKESRPFTFDFGPKELINMVGLSQNEGLIALKKFLNNSAISVVDDKIHVAETSVIARQVGSLHKEPLY